MGCCCVNRRQLPDETKSLMTPNQSTATPETFQTLSASPVSYAMGDNLITKPNEYKQMNHEATQNEPGRDPDDKESLAIISEDTNNSNNAMRIQIEQLSSFNKHDPWILDKDRTKESPASSSSKIKAFSYDKEALSRRRVTLTNTHNFEWFISIIQGALYSAEVESEITRAALDKILNLSPVPWRDKIWEICNVECDSFIVNEEFEEFVDALLLATAQLEINMQAECAFFCELRDMNAEFRQNVRLRAIFVDEKCVANEANQAKRKTLSTFGASKVIVMLRKLKHEDDIPPNDIAIPLLTGFTRKAMKHSVTFCTKIWWKILTDKWWNEDDEDEDMNDLALDSLKKSASRSKKRQISEDIKRHLAQLSMDDLFGSDESQSNDDESDLENDSNYLNI